MFQPGLHGTRTETIGATTASSDGTTIPSGAGADSKGSWTSLGTTVNTFEAITICCAGASNASNFLVDLGISDGTNIFPILSDFHVNSLRFLVEIALATYIPLHVPAGSALVARSASSAGNTSIDVVVIGHTSGLGGTPGFSRCITLFTPASSRGVGIDPGGSASTKGSWTQMTSSCPATIGAMFGLIGNAGDNTKATIATHLFDIGIGASGNESVLYPNALVGRGSIRDGNVCPRIPLFACHVAEGTRIAARASCTDTTAGDRILDLSLYGLVQ